MVGVKWVLLMEYFHKGSNVYGGITSKAGTANGV